MADSDSEFDFDAVDWETPQEDDFFPNVDLPDPGFEDDEEEDENPIIPPGFDFSEISKVVDGINDNVDDPASEQFLDAIIDPGTGTRYLRISYAGMNWLKVCLQATLDKGFDYQAIFNLEGNPTEHAVNQRWRLIRFLDEEKLLPTDLALDRREILVGSMLVLVQPTLLRWMQQYKLNSLEEVIRAL